MIVTVHTNWKKSGTILQLVAVLLLQLYIFLPSLARAVTPPHGKTVQCAHDHRLCGCSPERIANHTCCCCTRPEPAEPPCCAGKHHDEKSAARPLDAPSQRRICAVPCGGNPQFIAASLDKIKFVRCDTAVAIPTAPSSSWPPGPRGIFRCRSDEPPVPPPKIPLSPYVIS